MCYPSTHCMYSWKKSVPLKFVCEPSPYLWCYYCPVIDYSVKRQFSARERELFERVFFVNLKLLAILQFESLIFLNLKHCISFWSFLPSLLRKCYWNIISVFFLFCFCRRYIFLGLFFFSYLLNEHMNIKSSLSLL